MEVDPTTYTSLWILVNATLSGVNQIFSTNLTDIDLKLQLGGNYIMALTPDPVKNHELKYTLHTITDPNSVHMAWLLPQFVIMTMGEIMFSITIMDFSYAEAPATMKSVMQSAWLMTVAFGNLIVVIIAELELFEQQWKEFFLFAGLMFVDMLLFAYMAYKYVPADKMPAIENPKANEKEELDGAGEENQAFEKQD